MPIVGILQLRRDLGGQAAGMHSRTIAKAPALLGRGRVGVQSRGVALHAVAAHRVDALRPQADVGHDGNARAHEAANHVGLVGAPFELDRLAARLLENAAGRFDRPLDAQVIRRERQIDDDERPLDRPADHLGVIDHLVERHGQRRLVPLHDHRHAVADQNRVDARRIEHGRRGIVVGRQHADLSPRPSARRTPARSDG